MDSFGRSNGQRNPGQRPRQQTGPYSATHQMLSGAGLAQMQPRGGNGNLMDEIRQKFGGSGPRMGQRGNGAPGGRLEGSGGGPRFAHPSVPPPTGGVQGQPGMPGQGGGMNLQPGMQMPQAPGGMTLQPGMQMPQGFPQNGQPGMSGPLIPGAQNMATNEGGGWGASPLDRMSPMDRAGFMLQLFRQMFGGGKF